MRSVFKILSVLCYSCTKILPILKFKLNRDSYYATKATKTGVSEVPAKTKKQDELTIQNQHLETLTKIS